MDSRWDSLFFELNQRTLHQYPKGAHTSTPTKTTRTSLSKKFLLENTLSLSPQRHTPMHIFEEHISWCLYEMGWLPQAHKWPWFDMGGSSLQTDMMVDKWVLQILSIYLYHSITKTFPGILNKKLVDVQSTLLRAFLLQLITTRIIASEASIGGEIWWRLQRNWDRRDQFQVTFGPDWFLGSYPRAPVASEPSSDITLYADLLGNYAGSAYIGMWEGCCTKRRVLVQHVSKILIPSTPQIVVWVRVLYLKI